MSSFSRKLSALSVLLAAVGAAPSAMAAWTFNAADCSGEPALGGTSATGGAVQCYADGTTQKSVEITAWTAGSGANFAAAKLGYYQNGATPANTEFGVTTGTSENSPNHAMDNNGKTEFLLFDFSKAGLTFKMTQFLTGWASNDSDVTIMAYTGTGTPNVTGKTVETMIDSTQANSSWTLVGNCNDTDPGNSTSNSTWYSVSSCADKNTTITSSWWIISAFNGNYKDPNVTGWDALADYVKIAAIDGTTSLRQGVPEPASLALVLVALAGAAEVGRRRRQNG